MDIQNQIQQPACPVEWVKVNENQSRLTAWVVLLLLGCWWFFTLWWIPALLAIDFLLRAGGWVRWSFLFQISQWGIKALRISYLPTDRGPKRFAAGLGLVFSVSILLTYRSGFVNSSGVLTFVMAFCAFLEGAFSCCLGCHVYTFVRFIFSKFNR